MRRAERSHQLVVGGHNPKPPVPSPSPQPNLGEYQKYKVRASVSNFIEKQGRKRIAKNPTGLPSEG